MCSTLVSICLPYYLWFHKFYYLISLLKISAGKGIFKLWLHDIPSIFQGFKLIADSPHHPRQAQRFKKFYMDG